MAAAVVIACAIWPGAGHSQEAQPRLSLRWNAPDACPDDATLVRRVEEELAQPLAEARQQSLSISAHVAGDSSGGFAAKLRFSGPNGVEERFLEHPDCAKLADAVALVMALAIDPERVKARQDAMAPAPFATGPSAAPSPVLPPSAPPPIPAPRPANETNPSTAAHSTRRAWVVELAVLGFAGAGALPSVGPGLGIGASARAQHVELGLVGRYWFSSVQPVPGVEDADVRVTLASFGLRGCAVPWLVTWQLSGCLGAELGDLWGAGEGAVEQPRTRHALLPSLSAGLALRYGRQRLVPFIGAEGSLALARPSFGVGVNGRDHEAFRADAGTVQAFVGLSYRL
jgi:hypothetical protein